MRSLFFVGIAVLISVSCQTRKETISEPISVQNKPEEIWILPETVPIEEPIPEVSSTTTDPVLGELFNPASITQEVYDTTKGEVQTLIETLNQIIRDKDYESWVQYLSAEYMAMLSDPDFLKNTSESSRLKNQNIVLKSLKDYFLYVVVPSRANDRVDDIEFIGQNRVKAYTITSKGQRLRLYELEKTAGKWNIVN